MFAPKQLFTSWSCTVCLTQKAFSNICTAGTSFLLTGLVYDDYKLGTAPTIQDLSEGMCKRTRRYEAHVPGCTVGASLILRQTTDTFVTKGNILIYSSRDDFTSE